MDFPISAFMKHVLRDEYMLRSKILYNMSVHIEELNSNCIIHHSLRSKYVSTLNGIIKDLNETYNVNVRFIKNSQTAQDNMGIEHYDKSSNFYSLMNPHIEMLTLTLYEEYTKKNGSDIITFDEFSKSVYVQYNIVSEQLGGLDKVVAKLYDNVKHMFPLIKYGEEMSDVNDIIKTDMFNEVDKSILNLALNSGFGSFADSFRLILGECYRDVMKINDSCTELEKYLEPYHRDKSKGISLKILNSKIQNSYACFDLLENCFIPVKTIMKEGDGERGIKVEKKIVTNRTSKEDSNKFKYEIMLDNCYKITTKTNIPNVCVISVGYFNYDAVNVLIRTSKINTYFINVKNSLLQKYIDINVTDVDDNFKTVYFKNLQVGDILSHSGESLKEVIHNDYHDIYAKCTCTKFRTIMAEFLKMDLGKKYTMLKILLMGHKDAVRYAGLLYALTKDQHRDSKNNYSLLSNILYRNLNYPLQCKLKKSGYYIKDEMERLKEMSCEDVDLKKQVLISMTMPDNVKKIAMAKIDEMKNNNSEYYKYYQYVKCLIDYPWINENETDTFATFGKDLDKCKTFLDKTEKDLNGLVYGHTECKSVITELLAKWMSNSKSMGKAIGLCGPPGVGKTLIAKGLGKVLGIPCKQINVGGMDDASVLCGHSITYSGAQYGLIVRKMCESGKSRCIIFCDELDKACARHGINEIFNVLIHATDPNTNSEFNDKYFQEVQFPLTNVLFVFSFNDKSKIDNILLDRMEIINVNAYSVNDKIKIVKDFLLNEIIDGFGLERGSVTFCDDTIVELIDDYTFEAGVRGLKRKLDTICSKLNLDRIYKRGPFKDRDSFDAENPIVVKISDVHNYLSKPTMSIKKIHKTHEIGTLSGLYATTIGSGGIIPILMYKNHMGSGKFTLRLTGSQGKVMKESVLFAFTVAMNCVKSEYRNKFLAAYKTGLHIHTPDGATKKDGPSAGSAFTTAFISRILNKHIKHDIAMTGEIETGKLITEIGGLEHKLSGAKKAGVRLVLCPRENMDDVIKIKKSNPNFMMIWNPEKDKDLQKLIDDCEKEIKEKQKEIAKQHKKLGDNEKRKQNCKNFRVLIVNNIMDVLKYVLIDDIKMVSKKYDTYKSYFNPTKYIDENDEDIFNVDDTKSEVNCSDADVINCDDNTDESEASEESTSDSSEDEEN